MGKEKFNVVRYTGKKDAAALRRRVEESLRQSVSSGNDTLLLKAASLVGIHVVHVEEKVAMSKIQAAAAFLSIRRMLEKPEVSISGKNTAKAEGYDLAESGRVWIEKVDNVCVGLWVESRMAFGVTVSLNPNDVYLQITVKHPENGLRSKSYTLASPPHPVKILYAAEKFLLGQINS